MSYLGHESRGGGCWPMFSREWEIEKLVPYGIKTIHEYVLENFVVMEELYRYIFSIFQK
jgi:hypothetical protein